MSTVLQHDASIVIPTHGAGRIHWLERCLEGVGRNLCPGEELEVVVVVDGGDEANYAHLLDLDVRPRIVARPHAGPAAARNWGWRQSMGSVVIFLDDDAVPAPDWLRTIMGHFARHSGVDGLGGAIEPLEPRNVVSRMVRDFGHIDHHTGKGGVRLITANAAFRRSALEAVGGFDERFTTASGEDFDLCVRMAGCGLTLAVIPGAAVYHRHPTTVRSLYATARRYHATSLMITRDTSRPLPPPAPLKFRRRAKGYLRAVRRRTIGGLRSRRPPGVPEQSWERVVTGVELITYTAPSLRRLPMYYAHARRSASSPGVFTAIGEAGLQMLWRGEFQRPVPDAIAQ